MTKREMEKQLEELTRRVRELESRPITLQPIVVPMPAQTPSPFQAYSYSWTAPITC